MPQAGPSKPALPLGKAAKKLPTAVGFLSTRGKIVKEIWYSGSTPDRSS
jgi:hypothetical protein